MDGRTIAFATQIPDLHTVTIPLLVGRKVPAGELEYAGAKSKRTLTGERQWWITREKHVDLDRLKPWLPRYAQRTVYPKIPDLIPATSWSASLASLLARSSWEKLRLQALETQLGCLECGHRTNLECHEVFEYVWPVQTLVGFETLCHKCHMTRHIGYARSHGHGEEAIYRMAILNRLEDHEVRPFIRETERIWVDRSKHAWQLGLGMIANMHLELRSDVEMLEPNFVFTVRRGMRMRVRFSGAEVEQRNGRLVLIPQKGTQTNLWDNARVSAW